MQKNRKKIIITLLAVVLVLALAIFFFIQNTKIEEGGIPEEPGKVVSFFQGLMDFGRRSENDKNSEEDKGGGFFDFFGGGNKSEENKGDDVKQMPLRKISSMPVSGYGTYLRESFEYVAPPEEVEGGLEASVFSSQKPIPPKTEFLSFVKYANKENGNLYLNSLDEENERKFTETIIPNIHESFFLNDTASSIARFLRPDGRTIATFLGQTREEILGADYSTLSEFEGSFLTENILDVSISPDEKSFFFLVKVRDGIVGTVSSFDSKSTNQIFSSPLTEWLSFWPNENTITLTTKASGEVFGYMYRLNPKTKELNKVLGEVSGLTTLMSPDGKKILFSNNFLLLQVYDIETREVLSLDVTSLSEKCVWASDSVTLYCALPKNITRGLVYPDVWYQGEVEFFDELWEIKITDGLVEKRKILDLAENDLKEEIDAINIKLDKKEERALFMNKKDNYLWSAKVK